MMCEFFEQFRKLDVKMFFFRVIEEGGKPNMEKARTYSNEEKQIISGIYSDENVERIYERHSGTVPWLGKIELREVAAQYGQCVYAQSYDNFWCEMGALALKYKALAIVSDKSNLLFYENQNSFQIWLSRVIDLAKMTTTKYNILKIVEHFELPSVCLPFAGIFLTSRSFDSKFVNLFNKSFGCVQRLFERNDCKFVEFLRQYRDDDSLGAMLEKMFGERAPDEIEMDLELFREYLNLVRKSDIEPEDPLLMFIKTFNDIQVYRTLLNLPYAVMCPFYDSNRYKRTQYLDMVQEMLNRRNGVLLNHRKDMLLKRTLYSDISKCSLILYPTYPTIPVPRLCELLDQINYEELNSERFKLLCWILNIKLSEIDLMKIPKPYFIAILTLYFLTKVNLYSIFLMVRLIFLKFLF